MAILPVGIGPQEGGYQIERSLRFNSADSAYLNRTPASTTNQKTFTLSFWVKRSSIGGSDQTLFSFGAGGTSGLSFEVYWGNSNTELVARTLNVGVSAPWEISSSQVFRDPSAWYHIVIAVDTTQATNTNRVKMYSNGIQITSFRSATWPTQNYDTGANTNTQHRIGVRADTVQYLNGYLTDINFIDGQALDPTSFGEYNSDTGVWQPKAYTGSYGTNGFYLDFADNSSTTALGYDAAGSNDWTPNNFSVTAGAGNDSLVDTPTPYGTDTGAGGEVRGNYATLNAISTQAPPLSNGNLDYSTSVAESTTSSISMSSGKWYCEVTVGGSNWSAGIVTTTESRMDLSSGTPGACGAFGNGNVYSVHATNTLDTFTSSTAGDVIGWALDVDAKTCDMYQNGTKVVSWTTITQSAPFWFAFDRSTSTPTQTHSVNFGQRPFAYTAPSGFKALCTQNLPEPTVVDGSTAMNVVTYTGTGSTRSVTGVGFQPDFTWLKERSNVRNHYLYDVVRGPLKELYSNLTSAESSNTIGLSAFDSDGFTINSGDNAFNGTGNSYVAWNWKAGGTGVTNTAGTITSTVSANTTAGFSIVTYTGTGSAATVGHGLGVAPRMVITKSRSGAVGWGVMAQAANSGSGHLGRLLLNETASWASTSEYWNNTAPTSSVFSVGTNSITNASGGTYVAYCFAPIAGYSAFGSYTGNGSSDGPFVYTGFRPRFIMCKSSSGTDDWLIADTVRGTYNYINMAPAANLSNAESYFSGNNIDVLSNGFKLRNAGNPNASGGTYIYAAFAENPFKYSLAR